MGPSAGSTSHLALTVSQWRQSRQEQARQIRAQRQQRFRARQRTRPSGVPWLTVDGEGWGTDELGRQCYRFLAAADEHGFEAVYHAQGERLTTAECLGFLCSLGARHVAWARRQSGRKAKARRPRLTGFALGYDYAHILLDLDLEQLREIFHNQDHEAAWVEYEDWRLKLTAGRLQVKQIERGLQRGYADLWDSFRYFQTSFLKAAERIMSAEERVLIEAGKERRGEDAHDPLQEQAYALAECRVHSRLMATVENEARALDLHPTSWYGPGSLANLALKQQGVGECHRTDAELEAAYPSLCGAAARAFVGGRFETTGHGRLPVLWEQDIHSAYPFATTRLPCLLHTTWEHFSEGPPITAYSIGDPEPQSGMYWTLYRVRWSNGGQALKGGWGPWPCRVQPAPESEASGQMLPVWPWSGEAWVWGPEYRAGIHLLHQSPQASYEVLEAWVPRNHCDCTPFAWVQDWYARRQAYKQAGDPREYWLKLILNSLYGKLAQQVGRAHWHSWLWSGMITAQTRALLLGAIALDPEAVMMTATDAVYSLRPLPLAVNDELGSWGSKILTDLLVVQSGFLKSAEFFKGEDHPRTRGIPPRFVDWDAFEAEWQRVLDSKQAWDLARCVISQEPNGGPPFQIHVGLGLAQLWGKPEMLGRWLDYPTTISFLTDKRPQLWEGPRPQTRELPTEERYRSWDAAYSDWAEIAERLSSEKADLQALEHDWLLLLERVHRIGSGIAPDRDYPARRIPRALRGAIAPDVMADSLGLETEALISLGENLWTRLKAAPKPARIPAAPFEPLLHYQGWIYTQPWQLPSNPGSEYRTGRGIGEDRFLVSDQPNASEWGSTTG